MESISSETKYHEKKEPGKKDQVDRLTRENDGQMTDGTFRERECSCILSFP